MSTDNPYEPGSATDAANTGAQSEEISSEQAAYNIVSDTVIGLNVRMSDNIIQGLIILITVILLATTGAIVALLNPDWGLPWLTAVMMGAFAGLVIGFFASGVFLMVYRTVRHLKGKHD